MAVSASTVRRRRAVERRAAVAPATRESASIAIIRYNREIAPRMAGTGKAYSMTTALKGTFAFVSLRCPKNTVDSERMLGKLAQEGYALTPDANGADVVVVNTCGFIEPARQIL